MQIVVLFWVRKFTHLHEKDNYMFDPDDSLVFVTTLLFSMDLLWGAIIVTLTCFFLLQEVNIGKYSSCQMGRSGVDRASSSDARGSRFEPRSAFKWGFFTPMPKGFPRARQTPNLMNWSKGAGLTKN